MAVSNTLDFHSSLITIQSILRNKTPWYTEYLLLNVNYDNWKPYIKNHNGLQIYTHINTASLSTEMTLEKLLTSSHSTPYWNDAKKTHLLCAKLLGCTKSTRWPNLFHSTTLLNPPNFHTSKISL